MCADLCADLSRAVSLRPDVPSSPRGMLRNALLGNKNRSHRRRRRRLVRYSMDQSRRFCGRQAAVSMRIEIELDDEDLKRFRAMFDEAREVAESMDRNEIIAATRRLVDVAAASNPRGFIRSRI